MNSESNESTTQVHNHTEYRSEASEKEKQYESISQYETIER